MRKILVVLLMLSLLLIYTPTVNASESIDLNAKSYILLDSKTGQILFEHNANERLFPASTTKIMTAILAIEKGNLNQVMTASKAAVNDIGKDGMNIGIEPNEQLPLEDLLHALLITSANETANIIAENICPTRSSFVDLMNEKAKELGAANTNFVNPCGSHNPNHYTTAKDLSTIARYAMTLPKFREIVAQDSYQLPATNKHSSWGRLPVTNKLLGSKSNFYTQVIGVKTGSTSEAGNNLVSSAVNSEGMELLAVVMDVRDDPAEKEIFQYSRELLEYGFKNFSTQRLATKGDKVKSVPVTDSKDNANVDLLIQNNLDYVLPKDKSTWKLGKVEHINPSVIAPVKEGDVLGSIDYTNNDVVIGKVNLVAGSAVEKSIKSIAIDTAKTTAKNSSFAKIMLIALGFLIAFTLLKNILRKISRRKKEKKKEK